MWQLNSETNSEQAWSCSHSKYTELILNYTSQHLDFSKDFTDKAGYYTLHNLSFIAHLFWV